MYWSKNLMNEGVLKDLLMRFKSGEFSVQEVLDKLKTMPFEDLGFACVDHHRGLRHATSEVIFGEGKTTEQILSIMEKMVAQGDNVLITRLSENKAGKILRAFPDAVYHKEARAVTLSRKDPQFEIRGTVLVISAGTSDIPVAEEAAVTAGFLGNPVEKIYDVGVAGLHRVLAHAEKLKKASVIIVVAGMEGALPSVIGGLVAKPVIAVPTSIGYGASFGGIGALLGMLNSCASGVVVVNIDNGFGAGYAASLINSISAR